MIHARNTARHSPTSDMMAAAEAVAQVEFLEWTAGDRLRHSKFIGLREDKDARQVLKERL